MRARGFRAVPVPLGMFLILATACSPARYSRHADREVAQLLRTQTVATLGGREETVEQPLVLEAEPETDELDREVEPLPMDLTLALSLAVQGNRGYATRREDLYLSILNLLGTRHTFSPQLSSLLSYTFSDLDGTADVQDGLLTIGATQVTYWGGVLSFDGSVAGIDSDAASPNFGTNARISLSQPLLRGAGYEVSHEALVQAERNAIYAIRDFELFREDFSIDVAARFYGLVRTQKEIDNQRENLERSTFDLNKAEALFRVGRESQIVSLRAKRQNLNSQNALLAGLESYEQELDDFRIFLGLHEETRVEIEDSPPTYIPVNFDVKSAIRVAMINRLDLLTRQSQVEDAERAVRIAGNGLLPDLGLRVSAGLSSDSESSIGDLNLNRPDAAIGFDLSLPLDRYAERNRHRATEIALVRQRRELDEFEEDLRAGIRNSLRELSRRRNSVRITQELIEGEVKNKRIAELQFERGEIDNRELVDAEQSLLDARNDLINERVNYEISRLRLLRDLGILFVDETGMWNQ